MVRQATSLSACGNGLGATFDKPRQNTDLERDLSNFRWDLSSHVPWERGFTNVLQKPSKVTAVRMDGKGEARALVQFFGRCDVKFPTVTHHNVNLQRPLAQQRTDSPPSNHHVVYHYERYLWPNYSLKFSVNVAYHYESHLRPNHPLKFSVHVMQILMRGKSTIRKMFFEFFS